MTMPPSYFGLDGLPPLGIPTSWGVGEDEYTRNMFLMNPWDALSLAVGYLLIVWIGKKWMEKREPFDLYAIRVLHNFCMVAVSAYMTFQLTFNTLLVSPTTWWCVPADYTEIGDKIAWVLWLFYFTKPIEFIDTFIMVLRKKNAQISFLHLYHHTTIFVVWHINVRYFPRGDGWFSAAFNALVHVLMYGYYFLRTLNIPCPWKQFITQFQILQFVSFVGQGAYGLYHNCPHSNRDLWWFNMTYAFTLLSLFVNFYVQNYNKKPKKKGNKKN